MKTIVVIPARFKSSRFPGKPLKKILKREMIFWVAESCAKAVGKKNILVATDDKRIFKAVREKKYNVCMTSKNCVTGTDRVYQASNKIKSDIYINVQGDEPLVKHSDIVKIINAKKKFRNSIICGYTQISKNENYLNKNIPKVLFNHKKNLIYISRLPIPGRKNQDQNNFTYYKQVCIYAFNKKGLKKFYDFGKKSKAENSEDIEIIRFLELNIPIKMVKLSKGSIAVDTKSDIIKAEKIIKKNEKRN